MALNQGTILDCISKVENHPMLQGSATPDAFAFSSPSFEYNSFCPPQDNGIQLHNLEFAGFMIQQVTDPDVRNILMGYGAHMVADLVGFNIDGGYLSSGLTTKFGNINWLTMQPKMQSIDSYLMHTLKLTANLLPQDPISTASAAFIATSTTQYQLTHPSFPVYNSTIISQCTTSWAEMINRLYNYYSSALSERTYQEMMVYFDELNSTSFNQTELLFKENAFCAAVAIQFWWNEINEGVAPDKAVTDTQQFITDMYQMGSC
jgi:hypothetical protein